MLLDMVRVAWTMLRDKRGAETAEWIIILAIVVSIAIGVYITGGGGATLTATLTGVITTIGAAIAGIPAAP